MHVGQSVLSHSSSDGASSAPPAPVCEGSVGQEKEDEDDYDLPGQSSDESTTDSVKAARDVNANQHNGAAHTPARSAPQNALPASLRLPAAYGASELTKRRCWFCVDTYKLAGEMALEVQTAEAMLQEALAMDAPDSAQPTIEQAGARSEGCLAGGGSSGAELAEDSAPDRSPLGDRQLWPDEEDSKRWLTLALPPLEIPSVLHSTSSFPIDARRTNYNSAAPQAPAPPNH